MTRITGMVVHDLRFPTSRHARRVGCDEPGSRLLRRLRGVADRHVGFERPRHDVHHRPAATSCAARRSKRSASSSSAATSTNSRPSRARSGVSSRATVSCVGSDRRRASCTSRPPRSSTPCGICFGRRAGAPLWRYLADLPAERIVAAIDFRHITDALTPHEALALLRAAEPGRAERRGPAAQRRLSRVHHVGRLARIPRRPLAIALPRGARRRLERPEDQGWPGPRRRRPPHEDPAGGARPRPAAAHRCESGVGRRPSDRLG